MADMRSSLQTATTLLRPSELHNYEATKIGAVDHQYDEGTSGMAKDIKEDSDLISGCQGRRS